MVSVNLALQTIDTITVFEANDPFLHFDLINVCFFIYLQNIYFIYQVIYFKLRLFSLYVIFIIFYTKKRYQFLRYVFLTNYI